MGWFYGIKVNRLVNDQGELFALCLNLLASSTIAILSPSWLKA